MWYVLASSPVDFDKFRRENEADRMPRHLLIDIADRFDAELSVPNPANVTRFDRAASTVYGQPHHWEQARRIRQHLTDGDSVFTTGCDSGVPLALLCILSRREVSFAIGFADPSRVRSRIFGWLLAVLVKQLIILVTVEQQAIDVRRSFGRVASDVVTIGYTTDCAFFRPAGERAPDVARAVVAASGVERRDYVTLADAISSMEVDGRVCFASPNLSARTLYSMPDPVPPNVEFRYYEFDELRTLYQHAAVTVVPLLENRQSAGLTALFEAIACGSPVIITRAPGIIDRLIANDLVIGVDVGSVSDLRRAIKKVLTEPDEARQRAERARTFLEQRYATEAFLDQIANLLADLDAMGDINDNAT